MILLARSILRNLYERLIQRNIYKSEHNCAFQGRDRMREPPPPMMSAPMMMGRTRTMVAAAIGMGLLLLAAGAMVVDLGNQVLVNPKPVQRAANANLRVF